MKKLSLVVALLIIAFIFFVLTKERTVAPTITSFDECVAAGNAVAESYPEQCYTKDGQRFVRDIGNELDKQDLIRIDNPRPNTEVSNPVKISGEARGYWFFEATFPITIETKDGTAIASHYATAQSEWMTEEFVPFTAEIPLADYDTKQVDIFLRKANASGLPEHDDYLRVPVLLP